MAPSAEFIEKKVLGRKLRRGDVLIGDDAGPGSYQFESSEFLPSTDEQNSLNSLRIELMNLIPLSPQGPIKIAVTKHKDFQIEKKENCWSGVVPLEQRTDINFIKKLFLRLRK
jgi:hypothetical protein